MLKTALEIALGDDPQKKTKLSGAFSGKSFDFFCIFIEYFAIRASYKIKREKNGFSFSHLLEFNNCFVKIKTEKSRNEQIFLTFVYINDTLAVSMIEHKGRFNLKYTKYKPEEILISLE